MFKTFIYSRNQRECNSNNMVPQEVTFQGGNNKHCGKNVPVWNHPSAKLKFDVKITTCFLTILICEDFDLVLYLCTKLHELFWSL